MDSIENISAFLGLDQHGKATLLAGKMGVPFSENTNEMIYAIGATLGGKGKKEETTDWKDAIKRCNPRWAEEMGCCLASDDPTHCNNWPLCWAIEHNQVDLVRALLQDPRVDPSQKIQLALRRAAYYNHVDVTKLLLRDPRVDLDAAIAEAKKCKYDVTLANLKKLKE